MEDADDNSDFDVVDVGDVAFWESADDADDSFAASKYIAFVDANDGNDGFDDVGVEDAVEGVGECWDDNSDSDSDDVDLPSIKPSNDCCNLQYEASQAPEFISWEVQKSIIDSKLSCCNCWSSRDKYFLLWLLIVLQAVETRYPQSVIPCDNSYCF